MFALVQLVHDVTRCATTPLSKMVLCHARAQDRSPSPLSPCSAALFFPLTPLVFPSPWPRNGQKRSKGSRP
eukprot:14021863-Alexandrium_andersonii.AAC.1